MNFNFNFLFFLSLSFAFIFLIIISLSLVLANYTEQQYDEIFLWEDLKIIEKPKFKISAPNSFTTCFISPDNGDGYDDCYVYVELFNNWTNLTKTEIIDYLKYRFDKPTKMRNIFVYVTKNSELFNISYINETITNIYRGFNNFTKLSDIPSTAKWNKGEELFVKLEFERERFTPLHFNFNASNVELDPDVSACGSLNTRDAIYTLTQNVTVKDTCFTIMANNITLNCNGYEIKYNSNGGNNEYGVYSNQNFTTIKNCIIKEGVVAGISDYGIYFSEAQNGTIKNNAITTIGISGYGIHLSSSSTNILSNNTIITSGSSGCGIHLSSSSTNILSNNTIITVYGAGIFLKLNSNSNNLLSNTIITSGGYGYGIFLSESSTNVFSNNIITTFGFHGYGIQLSSSSNNNSFSGMNVKTNDLDTYSIYIYDTNHNFTIRDSILNSSYVGVQELYIRNAVEGGTWNFINVTRANGNPINISWTVGANGTLNMHWYLDVNVSDASTNNPLQDANVTGWDINNAFKFSELTNGNGRITRKTLLEYTRNATSGTNYTYFTPHIINTTLISYITNSTSVNLTTTLNTWLNIKLVSEVNITIGYSNMLGGFSYNNPYLPNLYSDMLDGFLYNNPYLPNLK